MKYTVQAEAINSDEDIAEIGAAGSGMAGTDVQQGVPGSTTLPGGDDEAAETEGFFDDDCPEELQDEWGNCPGDLDYEGPQGGGDYESEVAPPGMEPTVKALKKQKGIDNPFAVAWAQYNRMHKKEKKEGGAGSGVYDHKKKGEKKPEKKPYPLGPGTGPRQANKDTARGMQVQAEAIETAPESPHGALVRGSGKVEKVPIHAFKDDLQRKVSLRKVMIPDEQKQVEAQLLPEWYMSKKLFMEHAKRYAELKEVGWTDEARAAAAIARKKGYKNTGSKPGEDGKDYHMFSKGGHSLIISQDGAWAHNHKDMPGAWSTGKDPHDLAQRMDELHPGR